MREEYAFYDLLKEYARRLEILKPIIRRWANQRAQEGIPRLVLSIFLLDVARRLGATGDAVTSIDEIWKWSNIVEPVVNALKEVADQITGDMAARNREARAFEEAGKIAEAIALYEANVSDGFAGALPYDRLRVLYTERKDYLNAIRICEIAIKNRIPFPMTYLARLRKLAQGG
jgi:hypothetical protein